MLRAIRTRGVLTMPVGHSGKVGCMGPRVGVGRAVGSNSAFWTARGARSWATAVRLMGFMKFLSIFR